MKSIDYQEWYVSILIFQPKKKTKIDYQCRFVQNKKVASYSLIFPKQNWFNFHLNTFVGKWDSTSCETSTPFVFLIDVWWICLHLLTFACISLGHHNLVSTRSLLQQSNLVRIIGWFSFLLLYQVSSYRYC